MPDFKRLSENMKAQLDKAEHPEYHGRAGGCRSCSDQECFKEVTIII